jgi:hypothetical protein
MGDEIEAATEGAKALREVAATGGKAMMPRVRRVVGLIVFLAKG